MRDYQFIMRVLDVLRDSEAGRIQPEQVVKKLQRSKTKYMQTRYTKDMEKEQ